MFPFTDEREDWFINMIDDPVTINIFAEHLVGHKRTVGSSMDSSWFSVRNQYVELADQIV